MSLSEDLLALATELSTIDSRRPRQASLRRAVSTAYYALFHLLVEEAASFFVSGDRQSMREALSRAFNHGAMQKVAEGFASAKVSPKIKCLLPEETLPVELIRVAQAFVDLQQARHGADYDLGRRYFRNDSLALIDQARRAFTDWGSIRSNPSARVFLFGLLVQDRIRT